MGQAISNQGIAGKARIQNEMRQIQKPQAMWHER